MDTNEMASVGVARIRPRWASDQRDPAPTPSLLRPDGRREKETIALMQSRTTWTPFLEPLPTVPLRGVLSFTRPIACSRKGAWCAAGGREVSGRGCYSVSGMCSTWMTMCASEWA